ncbi:MAG: hypothetical protein K8L99_31825 [Anaerolineae bacterium]|nr:hypothetical protein [Anaerolineae bacterium]
MFKRVDESPALARFIEFISAAMAKQRGLPVVIGIGLVIISMVVQSVNVFAQVWWLELTGVIALHVGILFGLIGLLLSEPLGR